MNLVPLMEVVNLKYDEYGIANPKSSTGRLDVLTRLITDNATEFDRIEKGYKGQLYIEIAPLTFGIIVKTGIRLNQGPFPPRPRQCGHASGSAGNPTALRRRPARTVGRLTASAAAGWGASASNGGLGRRRRGCNHRV